MPEPNSANVAGSGTVVLLTVRDHDPLTEQMPEDALVTQAPAEPPTKPDAFTPVPVNTAESIGPLKESDVLLTKPAALKLRKPLMVPFKEVGVITWDWRELPLPVEMVTEFRPVGVTGAPLAV